MPEKMADDLTRWEKYWRYVQETGGRARVTWDVVPERAATEDLLRFQKHLNPELPLIDLGCGRGRQTRFLAQHFQRVIGVDISPAAVELARSETVDVTNIEYRVLDATNPVDCEALHDEVGDVNIYMRGVLHLIQKADRPRFVSGLATLVGEGGTLYQLELTTEAVAVMRAVRGSYLFASPSGFDNALELEACFPKNQWLVVESGQEATIGTVDLNSGEERFIPANYLIARRQTRGR